jgi:ABC-type multidrug transport system ATPase subunit
MRGKFYALKNVNLKLKRNEIYALLGSNGAGKTTLISILTNLLEKTSGRIIYSKNQPEKDSNQNPEHLADLGGSLQRILEEALEEDKTDLEKVQNLHYSNFGVCPQFDIFWPSLTIREHLNIFSMLNSSILFEKTDDPTIDPENLSESFISR